MPRPWHAAMPNCSWLRHHGSESDHLVRAARDGAGTLAPPALPVFRRPSIRGLERMDFQADPPCGSLPAYLVEALVDFFDPDQIAEARPESVNLRVLVGVVAGLLGGPAT